MRNMKKGGPSDESDENAEMRDDKIAEDYGEESGSEIEDDKRNLGQEPEQEESSDNARRPSRVGRRRRLVN